MKVFEYEMKLKQVIGSSAEFQGFDLQEAAQEKLKRSHNQIQQVKEELMRSQTWLETVRKNLSVV